MKYTRKTTAVDLVTPCDNGMTIRVHVAKVAAELLGQRQGKKGSTGLTDLEFDALALYLAGRSHKDIAAFIYGPDQHEYNAHKASIVTGHARRKVGLNSFHELLYIAYERGWVTLDNDPVHMFKPMTAGRIPDSSIPKHVLVHHDAKHGQHMFQDGGGASGDDICRTCGGTPDDPQHLHMAQLPGDVAARARDALIASGPARLAAKCECTCDDDPHGPCVVHP